LIEFTVRDLPLLIDEGRPVRKIKSRMFQILSQIHLYLPIFERINPFLAVSN
jgi:hypothetical protein